MVRWLAKGDPLATSTDTGPARLLDLFGITATPGTDLPVAALARVADMGVIDNDWWIRADPVCLHPQRDGLILQRDIGLTAEESAQLVAELNESLAAEGWLIKAPHPERWYLKPARAPRLTTTPLAAAVGRNIHTLLPQGEGSRLWHTRFIELHILLHTSPVNAAREARGVPPANSVWFWGGGRLPRVTDAVWSAVWTDDPLALGLARLADIHAQSPAAYAPGRGRELMVLAQATASVLEQVTAALDRGAIRSLLVLMDAGETRFCLRQHRWRFWRRAQPLPSATAEMA